MLDVDTTSGEGWRVNDIFKAMFRYGPLKADLRLDPRHVYGLRESKPSGFVDGDTPAIVLPWGKLEIDYDRDAKIDVFTPTVVRGWIKLGTRQDASAIWKDPKTGRVAIGEEPPRD